MFMQSMGRGWSVTDSEFSPERPGISAAGTFLSSGRLSPLLTDPFYKIVLISLYPAGKMSHPKAIQSLHTPCL